MHMYVDTDAVSLTTYGIDRNLRQTRTYRLGDEIKGFRRKRRNFSKGPVGMLGLEE